MGVSVPLLYHHIRRHCEDRDFSSPFVFLLNNVYIILFIAVFVTVDIRYIRWYTDNLLYLYTRAVQ